MTTVTIPRTADRCVDALAEVGVLITAKEWHRAAIIAALVGPAPGRGARTDLASNRQVMTTRELASQGIVGMSTHDTIERYRDAWHSARPTPELGTKIDLDGLPAWPPTDQRTGHFPERVRTQVGNRPVEERAQILDDLLRDPEVTATREVAATARPPKHRATVLDVVGTLTAARGSIRDFVTRLNAFEGRLGLDAQETVELGLRDIELAVGWARTLISENAPITDEALHQWLTESDR